MTEDQFIDTYLKLVLEANNTVNLTAITDYDIACILHIEDSLSALPEIDNAPEGLYADIGTGGGFPGVPIAIKTKRETILVDSVKKKLREIKSLLDLMDSPFPISLYEGRIEELANTHRNEFSVITARALSSLPSLLELSSPLLQKDGILVCYKGTVSEEELDTAIGLEQKLGMKLNSKRSFLLSDNKTNRTIITFKKIGEPEIKLPRKIGLAQKRPLKNVSRETF